MDAESLQRLVTEVALTELREDETARATGLKQMREWVSQNPNIRNCRTDDNFLLRFLRVKKYDLAKAQQMLYNFINLKNTLPPTLMGDHDVASPFLEDLICSGFYFCSPHRDDKGRKVILIILGQLDSLKSGYTYEQPARTIILSNLLLQEEDASQVLGYTFMFDATGVSMDHIAQWPSPLALVHFLRSGQAAIPMRNKEVHILNMPAYMSWFLNIAKTALNKKLRQRIMVHSSLESMHKKLNPRVLPKEYGGEISMRNMIDLWKAELASKRDTVRALKDMTLVDNKDKRHCSGLDRSFQNLEVD